MGGGMSKHFLCPFLVQTSNHPVFRPTARPLLIQFGQLWVVPSSLIFIFFHITHVKRGVLRKPKKRSLFKWLQVLLLILKNFPVHFFRLELCFEIFLGCKSQVETLSIWIKDSLIKEALSHRDDDGPFSGKISLSCSIIPFILPENWHWLYLVNNALLYISFILIDWFVARTVYETFPLKDLLHPLHCNTENHYIEYRFQFW